MKLESTKNHSSDEIETTIVITRNSAKARIYTNDNVVITKLSKRIDGDGYALVKTERNKDGVSGYFVECDKDLITFRKKAPRREYSEEERAVIRERLKENVKNKKSKKIT